MTSAVGAIPTKMGLLPANPRESLLPLELAEALEPRGLVQMEYLDVDEQRTSRIIEPLGIRRRHGELVLVAHCHLRNDRRTFKLERIVHLTRVEGQAQVRAEQPGLFGVWGAVRRL